MPFPAKMSLLVIWSVCSKKVVYLFIVSEFYGVHFLSPVFVVLELVLDGQGLEQFHGGLRSNLRNAVEEQNFLLGIASVVQLCGTQL